MLRQSWRGLGQEWHVMTLMMQLKHPDADMIRENISLLLIGSIFVVFGIFSAVQHSIFQAAFALLLGSTVIIWTRYRMNGRSR